MATAKRDAGRLGAVVAGQRVDVARLFHDVSLCGRKLQAALTELTRTAGLSEIEFLVLWRCGQRSDGGVPQHELIAATGASPAQLSGLVERLRGRGLLQSRRDDRDRRRQFWQLTEAGQRLLDGLGEHLPAVARRLEIQLEPGELSQLSQLIERLVQAIPTAPPLKRFDPDNAAPAATSPRQPAGTNVVPPPAQRPLREGAA